MMTIMEKNTNRVANNIHSVEKIGGTSMSSYNDVLNNIWLRKQVPFSQDAASYYQRIFVVSAYSGLTNALLEHKKNWGAWGVRPICRNG